MQFEIYVQNNDSNISWIKTIFVIVYGLEYISSIFGKRGWKERGMEMGMEKKEGERWQSDGSLMLLGKREKKENDFFFWSEEKEKMIKKIKIYHYAKI